MLNGLTEDVDIDSCSGTATAVGGLDDVGGAVVSLGLGNSDGGVSWFGVNGHPVVRFEDQVSFGPLHPGFGLTCYLGGELDLAACLGGQTGQQLCVKINLRRFCMDNKDESQS